MVLFKALMRRDLFSYFLSMRSLQPRIEPPTSTAAPSRLPNPVRLAHFLAEFLFTTTCSFVILVALLYLVGAVWGPLCATEFSGSSPFGILRVTAVCTLVVYAGFECCTAFLHRIRRAPWAEDDYGALETGTFEAELACERKTPFAMSPGGKARTVDGSKASR
ncbi:hypothetical protein B0H12DRAFT_1328751 [Mycena haematopus]|nr:hypothetical protein B0H12DRAFT_1328751 [Mycena haematopus]